MNSIMFTIEDWLIRFPGIGVFIFILIPGFLAFFTGWSYLFSITGEIKGKVLLQDSLNENPARVQLFTFDKLRYDIKVKKDGSFKRVIRSGNYAIKISGPGYENVIIDGKDCSKGSEPLTVKLNVKKKKYLSDW